MTDVTTAVRSAPKRKEWTLADAFPEIDQGVQPLGHKVLLQIRTSRPRSAGGIILTQDAREYEKLTSQVGKVLALGALCFKNRTTGESWPEENWINVGDYVLIPQHGGNRWNVPHKESDDFGSSQIDISFAIINDFELVGKITGDPLKIKSGL